MEMIIELWQKLLQIEKDYKNLKKNLKENHYNNLVRVAKMNKYYFN